MELLQIELLFGWMLGRQAAETSTKPHIHMLVELLALYGDSFDGRRRRGLRKKKE
jgi:hypothetical protein